MKKNEVPAAAQIVERPDGVFGDLRVRIGTTEVTVTTIPDSHGWNFLSGHYTDHDVEGYNGVYGVISREIMATPAGKALHDKFWAERNSPKA